MVSKKKSVYGKVDRTWKRRWVKRLLSGKDTQATGQLRIGDGFCCLGVFCDVYDPKRWRANEYKYSTTRVSCSVIPSPLMKKIGLTELASSFLVEANDSKRWSLKRIGRWIDKNL